MAKANAIERRVRIIEDLWNEFAENPDARLARFLGPPNDLVLVDVFVEMQLEEGGESPDLFLKLRAPFDKPATFGFELAREVAEIYEASREGLVEEGLPADWQPPQADDDPSDHRAFARTLVSLHQYHRSLMERLAIFLTPDSVADPGELEKWLFRLLAGNMPEAIRLLLVDRQDEPILARLAEKDPKRVQTIPINLDMPSAVVELSRGEAASFGPDARLRRHMMGLSNAGNSHDLEGADREANAAIAVCKEQGWPQLGVSVLLMLGGVRLGADRPDLALEAYSRAARAAEAAGKQERPEAPNLLLQSRLAEGACLLKMGEYARAAETYSAAGPLAESLENWFCAYESWRMAAFCKQTLGENDAIWPAAAKGLAAAEKIEPGQRPNSTLPYFAQALLAAAEGDDKRRDGVRKRFEKLLGPEWESMLP